jgi:hypothetical protein
MDKRIFRATLPTVVLVLSLVGASSSAFAVSGHGSSYGPTFGGGLVKYDGLIINGHTYNISKYAQSIQTETLHLKSPSTITLKLWENGGVYQIQHIALFTNVKSTNPSATNSDTWAQYDKKTGVTIHDPHKILGDVKVDAKYDGGLMYVTFHLNATSHMDTSALIAKAWDSRLAMATTTIINAIKIV